MRGPDDGKGRPDLGGHRALVVGAGGFLGQEVVRALANAGWVVRGLVRNAAYGDRVRAVGGEPVRGDVLDVASVRHHADGCELIVHLAANPSGADEATDIARAVRVEGAANLVRAARAVGSRRLIVGSGYWVYGDQPGTITESSPVDPQGESRINYEAERAGLEANAPELEVLVVRPGMVYGDGAWFRPMAEAIRDGEYRTIEGGTNRWSFVSLPDTGTGFLRVAARGTAGEVYNLVDGDPRPWAEFARFVAGRLGAPSPPSQSVADAVSQYGATIATHLRANRAVSSAKVSALGWAPTYPHYAPGVEAVLRRMRFA